VLEHSAGSNTLPLDRFKAETLPILAAAYLSSPDSGLEEDFEFYMNTAEGLCEVNSIEAARKTASVAAAILEIAYHRGLPFALAEVHGTPAIS